MSNNQLEDGVASTASEGYVLLGCVGFSPVSVVAMSRAFRPNRAVLIATQKSLPQLEAVTRQLAIPVRSVVLEGDGMERIDQLQAKISTALKLEDDEAILLDLTGGTKIMTVATYEAARLSAAKKIKSVYLTPDGSIIDASGSQDPYDEPVLEISEVLEWQGASILKSEWMGQLRHVPNEVSQRVRLGRFTNVFTRNVAARSLRTPTVAGFWRRCGWHRF